MRGLLVAGLLAAASACGGGDPPPNVLLLVVDTLRQDHLGAYGYAAHPSSPALDQLAAEGVRFEGLTGVSSWTKPSMATLFTGLTPVGHRVSRLADLLVEPRTLAWQFQEAGYATGCVMSNFLLGARVLGGRTSGYAKGFGFYDDELTRREEPHLGTTSAEVTRRALNWLGSRGRNRPWFLVAHYFDPHIAYEENPRYEFTDPGYRGWVEGGLLRKVLREHQDNSTTQDRAQLAAIYDEEIRSVDDALGELLESLRHRGDWENTLVIFTSDHGEELAERGYIGHTVSLHHEQVDLPLVLRLPRGARAGTEIRARVSQADLPATILDLCGLDSLAGRGRSFADWITGAEQPAGRPCFSEIDFKPAVTKFTEKNTRMRSVVDGGFKLVHDLRANRFALYDLRADPGEWRDLAEDPAHATERDRLAGMIAGHDWLELQ